MNKSAVFDVIFFFLTNHTGFFHHTQAGRVFHKGTCADLAKALLKEVSDEGSQGFGHVTLIVESRINDITQLNVAVLDAGVVKETDEPVVENDGSRNSIRGQ